MPGRNPLFDKLRAARDHFDPDQITALFDCVDADRVAAVAESLSSYFSTNLPKAIERRNGLADYRTNPYVLMTSASVMGLDDPQRFAEFLFNSKLYMALETSFGKSVEAAFVGHYPFDLADKWAEPPEKIAEFAELIGLSREEKARRRTQSVWREIDRACVSGRRRYMTTIKSGPNTINDTQVQGMVTAIATNHAEWARQTRANYPEVAELDVVVGLTYGTDRTTNNKENQILVKLLEHGFVEEDHEGKPGILIDEATSSTRVYRRIGKDFWAFIGNPDDTQGADFVFLEILLALAKALSAGIAGGGLEDEINRRLRALSQALAELQFPRNSLPHWIRDDFSEDELFWFATAMTAFYDEGI